MIRKISLILAVVLLCGTLLALTGCNKEKYDFTALEGNTDGEVFSNGGIAVIKGDYLYYVNGTYTWNANIPNKFGQVLEGSILRILNSKYAEILTAQSTEYGIAKQIETEATSGYATEEAAAQALPEEEKNAAIATATERRNNEYARAQTIRDNAVAATKTAIQNNAEIVVPKIAYYDTADKSLNGIYIYGDRIYYMTPDVVPDKNGRVQNERLVLMSAKLNGTDTKVHYTFADNNILSTTDVLLAVCMVEVNGVVYAMYLNETTLRVLDMRNHGNDAKIVYSIDNVYNPIFDRDNAKLYYTNQATNEIWCYCAGASDGALVTDSAYNELPYERPEYTINSLCNGKLYVTTSGSMPNQNSTSVIEWVNDQYVITSLSAVVKDEFLAYDNYIIYLDGSNKKVAVYDTLNGKILHTGAYETSETDVLALQFIENGYLYYTLSTKLYRINLAEIDWTAPKLNSQDVAVIASGSHWARFDICGDYLFNFAGTATEFNAFMYFNVLCTREADFSTDTSAVTIDVSKR